MGRIYAVPFENVSVNAAQDLFYIAPADDKPCIVHGFCLCNVGGTADAGDAQEEFLRLIVRRGYTTVGSGGSSVATPAPIQPNDAAAAFTARINDTTPAANGTAVDLHTDGWNIRVPYLWLPTPELRPGVSQGNTSLVVRLLAAPNDAVLMSGTLYVEEW